MCVGGGGVGGGEGGRGVHACSNECVFILCDACMCICDTCGVCVCERFVCVLGEGRSSGGVGGGGGIFK